MDVNLAPAQIAQAEDLPAIANLLQITFGADRNWDKELAWQYLQNPAGKAIYVNAYSETGYLVAHYAVIPTSPFADPRFSDIKTYLSLNTAVLPEAQGKGLFKRTAQTLYDHLASQGPHAVLGVANENSVHGFITSLGFNLLGQLKVEAYFPGFSPKHETPRLLVLDADAVYWRLSRPFADYKVSSLGQIACKRHFKGLPLHCILTSGGLDTHLVKAPAFGLMSRITRPSIYATYGPTNQFAWLVPETLRPSPFHLICRTHMETAPLSLLNHIQSRRFEFIDFDVV